MNYIMSLQFSGKVVNFLANCVEPAPAPAPAPAPEPEPAPAPAPEPESEPAPEPEPAPAVRKPIPNIQGSYIQAYRVLRVPLTSQIQAEIDELEDKSNFLENYKFKYFTKSLESSDELEQNRVIIKQDKDNMNFGVIYEDILQSTIRPVAGVRPFMIIPGPTTTSNWILKSPDFDDNGEYTFEIITDDDNNLLQLEGSYIESGYDAIGSPTIQAPTVAVATYKRILSSIEISEEKEVEPENIDINKLYYEDKLPEDGDGVSRTRAVLEPFSAFNRGELNFSVDRTQYETTALPASQFKALANYLGITSKITSASLHKGLVYDSSNTIVIGTINCIKCVSAQDGTITLDSNSVISLFEEEDRYTIGSGDNENIDKKNTPYFLALKSQCSQPLLKDNKNKSVGNVYETGETKITVVDTNIGGYNNDTPLVDTNIGGNSPPRPKGTVRTHFKPRNVVINMVQPFMAQKTALNNNIVNVKLINNNLLLNNAELVVLENYNKQNTNKLSAAELIQINKINDFNNNKQKVELNNAELVVLENYNKQNTNKLSAAELIQINKINDFNNNKQKVELNNAELMEIENYNKQNKTKITAAEYSKFIQLSKLSEFFKKAE